MRLALTCLHSSGLCALANSAAAYQCVLQRGDVAQWEASVQLLTACDVEDAATAVQMGTAYAALLF